MRKYELSRQNLTTYCFKTSLTSLDSNIVKNIKIKCQILTFGLKTGIHFFIKLNF